VVPVDGQDWDTDPFTVVEKDGKLHGRGTCDMKGFDALAIWAAVEAKRRGVTGQFSSASAGTRRSAASARRR
jgi:acetylornithine deacetylase